jgi:orotidine-5'-phosphate decarboxylase
MYLSDKMPPRYFLALDYDNGEIAFKKGKEALDSIKWIQGEKFALENVSVKISQDLLTGNISKGLGLISKHIFADIKLAQSVEIGGRTIDVLCENIPNLSFVTVQASLGPKMLRGYVDFASKRNVEIIAVTAHTHMSEQAVNRVYNGRDLEDSIYSLAKIATDVGCHAVVLEGEMLKNFDIRNLPIKKLVTGIRLDVSDKGMQDRVTGLDDLSKLKEHLDYAVISSRYLHNPGLVSGFMELLRVEENSPKPKIV